MVALAFFLLMARALQVSEILQWVGVLFRHPVSKVDQMYNQRPTQVTVLLDAFRKRNLFLKKCYLDTQTLDL